MWITAGIHHDNQAQTPERRNGAERPWLVDHAVDGFTVLRPHPAGGEEPFVFLSQTRREGWDGTGSSRDSTVLILGLQPLLRRPLEFEINFSLRHPTRHRTACANPVGYTLSLCTRRRVFF